MIRYSVYYSTEHYLPHRWPAFHDSDDECEIHVKSVRLSSSKKFDVHNRFGVTVAGKLYPAWVCWLFPVLGWIIACSLSVCERMTFALYVSNTKSLGKKKKNFAQPISEKPHQRNFKPVFFGLFTDTGRPWSTVHNCSRIFVIV